MVQEDACPPASGIPIGGIGRIEFVGAAHPGQAWMHFNGIVDRERVVAGNTEDMLNAQIRQSVQGVLHNAGGHGGPERRPSVWSALLQLEDRSATG